MKDSPKIPADLWPIFTNSVKDSEGFSDTAYQDGRGYWTIGYGHKLEGKPEPGEYSKMYLETQLRLDLHKAEELAQRIIRREAIELSNVRFTVLVEMVFILGYTGVSKFLQFFIALQLQDWVAACFEMRHNTTGEESPWYKEEPSRVNKLCNRLLTDNF